MCMSKKENDPRSPVKEREIIPEIQSPRSPWAKLLNRQITRTRVTRKVASSTRVNLNKYWNKFGEIVNHHQQQPIIINTEANKENITVLPSYNFLLPQEPVKSCNEENIKNILTEKRFEMIANRGQEIDENIANEIREICFLSTNSCLICR